MKNPSKFSFSVIIGMALFSMTTSAQFKPGAVNFPSPNAATLGLYGDIPVNHFTGIPNIQVPLYTLSERDVQIPVALSYHTAAVKLNAHPGWTGLGWNLSTGGAITRVVKGGPDEIKSSTRAGYGYYFNHDKVNVGTWSSDTKLKEYGHDFLFGEPYNYEVMPDEFHFNFLGYSGTFYLDHTGQWVVQSDRDVKIIFEPTNGGFVSTSELREPLKWDVPSGVRQHNDTYFNKFSIVSDDGTIYEFGGIHATEYSVPYRNPETTWLIPTTWNLVKITSPKGAVITFEYEPGHLVCALSNGYSYLKYNKEGGGGWFSLNPSCSGTVVNFGRRPANGYLLFPVYLKRIVADNVSMEFTRSVTTEMRYDDYDLNYDSFYDPVYFYGFYFDNPNELQWEQLDTLKIMDSGGEIVKKYKFDYTNSSSTRLKLLAVTETDITNTQNATYRFSYNSNEMSLYCSDQLDHWGFYNGYDVSQFNPQTVEEWLNLYHSTREPDITGNFYKYEILEKITYPTGGHTTFEYEPHTYRKVVKKERTGLTSHNENKIAGGLRIKKVSSYTADGATPVEKEYFYVKGYSGQNPNTLVSSGILSGESQYYWPGYSAKDLDNNTFTYDVFSSSSLLPTVFNALGSHTGYSEVIERVTGNGYTKHTFTNYEPDIHGISHMDEAAVNWIDAERSIYSPSTSKSIERGKLTSITVFTESHEKVEEVIYHYQKSSGRYVRGLFIEHVNVCSGVNAAAQNWFGTAYKYYVYNFNKVKEVSKRYDQFNSALAFSKTTDYSYSNEKHISEILTEDTNNGKVIVKRKYPFDFSPTASGFIQGMLDKYMMGEVVEEQVWRETSAGAYSLASGELMEYSNAGSFIVPVKTYKVEARDPLSEAEFGENYNSTAPYGTFNSNNSNYHENVSITYYADANTKQVTQRNGISTVYVWGYNNHLPVAKIENATYNSVEQVLGTGFDLGGSGLSTSQENLLRSSGSLAKSLITTYRYMPPYGIISQTDPDGIINTFDYDPYGRLELLKDHHGNIIKKYSYQYKVN